MTLRKPNGAVAEWIKVIGALVLIPAIGWAFFLERRVAKIEGNRFTSGDAIAMYAELNRKADKDNVPPREVLEALQRFEYQIEELRKVMTDHLVKHGR